MLILVWFVVCIIFYFVQLLLGNSGHALEVFAVLSAVAIFLISKIKYKILLTGGYANFFNKMIKKKVIIDQDITIKGIANAYKELI